MIHKTHHCCIPLITAATCENIKSLLRFTHSVSYRCSVVGQVIQDTAVGQHRQFRVQGVFASLPTIISILIPTVLSSLFLFVFYLTLVITAFIFFQLRAEADARFKIESHRWKSSMNWLNSFSPFLSGTCRPCVRLSQPKRREEPATPSGGCWKSSIQERVRTPPWTGPAWCGWFCE